MADLRPSVKATFDSAEGGSPYWVTTSVNGVQLGERTSIPDPFVRQTVRLHWWDAVKALLSGGRVEVEVTVSAPVEIMNDVLELDDANLIPGRTRQAAFRQSMHGKLMAARDD
jgi:hypothetical protein